MPKGILIGGSKAASYWGVDLNRTPRDTDYFCYSLDCPFDLRTFKEVIPNFLYTNIEDKVEIFLVDNCPPLREILKKNKDTCYIDHKNLAIIKNAHKLFYMGNYKKSFKHIVDANLLLEGIVFSQEDKDLMESYTKWLIEFAYYNDRRLLKFPKLNKTKDEFFTDGVLYFVDHDLIHELVAIEEKPAYTKCLTGEVMFSNSLFNKLECQDKVNMVLEESFVLALERCLIPLFKGETYLPAYTPEEAFKYSLVRVSTNITSGDFRAFASDNFYKIYKEYVNKHTNYYSVISKLLGDS